jgi:hypothetical protein
MCTVYIRLGKGRYLVAPLLYALNEYFTGVANLSPTSFVRNQFPGSPGVRTEPCYNMASRVI